MKKEKETQKPITANQLIEATQATTLKKGEAIISIIKKSNETCHIKWSGTNKDLLDTAYTLLQNDMHMAAIICRAAKDFIDSCKVDPNTWMRLTNEIAGFSGDLVDNTTQQTKKEEAAS